MSFDQWNWVFRQLAPFVLIAGSIMLLGRRYGAKQILLVYAAVQIITSVLAPLFVMAIIWNMSPGDDGVVVFGRRMQTLVIRVQLSLPSCVFAAVVLV